GELRRLFSFGKAAWGARFVPPLDNYDIVHLHLPFFGVAEAVAGVPRVAMVATYHMDAVGTGLKKRYFNWWYRTRFKKVLAACDAIAVTSRAYARDSRLARAGVDVDQCEEILLRVDMDIFNPAAAPARAEPYFLFVGALDRAHYFKGLSLLLRAFKFLDSGSGAGMTLVVVGSGELLNEYKKEARELGIAGRVTFTGGVTDEELARWYAGARALVLPSTDRSEAFGIVLIEAMACGTPVIASDLPGVREVVERVNGGVLVSPSPWPSPHGGEGNLNITLVTALQNMWNTPWSAEDRAALAERAAAMYGRATLADQLMRWYTSVHVPSR
ncbi:MAG: glycosyltransferase family 4 protein, partial [Patescibacteria group bacterium]